MAFVAINPRYTELLQAAESRLQSRGASRSDGPLRRRSRASRPGCRPPRQHARARCRPRPLPEDVVAGASDLLEVRRRRRGVRGLGRDRVVELVELPGVEVVEVRGHPLLSRSSRGARRCPRGRSRPGPHERAAQVVAGEAIDAEEGDAARRRSCRRAAREPAGDRRSRPARRAARAGWSRAARITTDVRGRSGSAHGRRRRASSAASSARSDTSRTSGAITTSAFAWTWIWANCGRRRRRSRRRAAPRAAPLAPAGRSAETPNSDRERAERDRDQRAGDLAADDPEVALRPDAERLAREHRRAEAAGRLLHVVDLVDEVGRRPERERGDRDQDQRRRRSPRADARAPRRAARRQSIGLRPPSSSTTSQSGSATTNQTRPGRLKVKTLADREDRGQTTITASRRPGSGARVSAVARAARRSGDREGEHEQRHRGLLEGALGEERGGEVRQAAIARDRDPRSPPQPPSAASAASAVSAGIASSSPLKAADQRGARRLGGDDRDRLRADRIAEADRARLGAEPVLEPVGPVQLRGVVVGVDALAEDADPVVEQERRGDGEHDDDDARPRSASPARGRRGPAGAADSRTRRRRRRSASSPRTIAAVVARPGSRSRNGQTITSTAKPVAPESHIGRGQPAVSRIARPISSEAPTIRSAVA